MNFVTKQNLGFFFYTIGWISAEEAKEAELLSFIFFQEKSPKMPETEQVVFTGKRGMQRDLQCIITSMQHFSISWR